MDVVERGVDEPGEFVHQIREVCVGQGLGAGSTGGGERGHGVLLLRVVEPIAEIQKGDADAGGDVGEGEIGFREDEGEQFGLVQGLGLGGGGELGDVCGGGRGVHVVADHRRRCVSSSDVGRSIERGQKQVLRARR